MTCSSPIPVFVFMIVIFTIMWLYSIWPPLGMAPILLASGFLALKFQLWLFSPKRHNPLSVDPFLYGKHQVVVSDRKLQEMEEEMVGAKPLGYKVLTVFDKVTLTTYVSQEYLDYEEKNFEARIKGFPTWMQPYLQKHKSLTFYLYEVFIDESLALRAIFLFLLPVFVTMDVSLRFFSIFDYEFYRD